MKQMSTAVTTVDRTVPAEHMEIRGDVALGKAVRSEHDKVRCAAKSALEHARRCGDLLIQAKSTVGHGSWGGWLKIYARAVSPRTAQGYMQLARQWDSLVAANPQHVADFSLRKALRFVADQKRQATFAERKTMLIYTSPDGTQHVGVDAASEAQAAEYGSTRAIARKDLPPAVAERVADLQAKKKALVDSMMEDEQEVFDRAQAWAESTAAKLRETYRAGLEEIDAQIKAVLDTQIKAGGDEERVVACS